MKTSNALVTYTDLTTMGLAPQLNVNPPVGNQCATKNFILTNYRADEVTLSGYTSNRLPPYQVIIPTTVPYLACYALDVTTQYYAGCSGYTDTFETYTISLVDQFGNPYYTPTTLNFEFQYDYFEQDDVPPYQINDTYTINLTVSAGQYQGFLQLGVYTYRNCAMSGVCDGSCYATISNILLINSPNNLPGGCSAPAPTPTPDSRLFIPDGFSPNGDGINDLWRFYFISNGVYTEMVYANYPNMTWNIVDKCANVYYQNLTGGVYSPWNGHLNNNTSLQQFYGLPIGLTGCVVLGGPAYARVDLNDGSGRYFLGFVTLAY